LQGHRANVGVHVVKVSTNELGGRYATLLATNCGSTAAIVYDSLTLENPSGQWRTNELPTRLGLQKQRAAIRGTNWFGRLSLSSSPMILKPHSSFSVDTLLPFDSGNWRVGIVYSRLPSQAEWSVRGWLAKVGCFLNGPAETTVFTAPSPSESRHLSFAGANAGGRRLFANWCSCHVPPSITSALVARALCGLPTGHGWRMKRRSFLRRAVGSEDSRGPIRQAAAKCSWGFIAMARWLGSSFTVSLALYSLDKAPSICMLQALTFHRCENRWLGGSGASGWRPGGGSQGRGPRMPVRAGWPNRGRAGGKRGSGRLGTS
jgi:hypothetical protein